MIYLHCSYYLQLKSVSSVLCWYSFTFWDISSPPEEPPAIVRIITQSRPRQLEASSRLAELHSPTPRSQGNSALTPEEQNMALNKLNKKVYDPPNNSSRKISFYYRENNRRNYNERSNGDNDEEGKRCAVCLEDFQPKEEVMTTPCNHMFHEECIVPWVKSNGQCPVCRFALFERTERREASSNNTVSIAPASSLVDDDLVYLIRVMEDALMLRNLAGFWGPWSAISIFPWNQHEECPKFQGLMKFDLWKLLLCFEHEITRRESSLCP